MARGAGKRRKNRKKSKRPGKPAAARPAAAAAPALPAPRSHGEPEEEPVFVLVDPSPDAKRVFEDDLEPPPPPPPRRHHRRPPDNPAKRSLIRAALYAGIAVLVALVVLWVLQSSDPNRVPPTDPPPIVQPQ
jgi:hypothetical protein